MNSFHPPKEIISDYLPITINTAVAVHPTLGNIRQAFKFVTALPKPEESSNHPT